MPDYGLTDLHLGDYLPALAAAPAVAVAVATLVVAVTARMILRNNRED